MAKYDELNPAALRRLIANGAKLKGFSPAIMEACFKSAKDLHAEIAATNEPFKKVYDLMTELHQQRLPVVPGCRAGLRLLHGPPL